MSADTGVFNDEKIVNGSIFGARKKEESFKYFPDSAKFRIFTGCMAIQNDRLVLEDLFTRSYHCQGYLNKPGDMTILDYSGTFNKEGEYCVYVRYVEIPAEKKDGESNS